MSVGYRPYSKNRAILDRAWEIIDDTPYDLTLRALFYALYQEGYYADKKSGYASLIDATSQARHRFYKGWNPGTLVDDTRPSFIRGDGHDSIDSWIDALEQHGVNCPLDRWSEQDVYVELWYEGRGMTRQFLYAVEHTTLRAMGGMSSIHCRWEAAMSIRNAYDRYGIPVVVLFFGDYDDDGLGIARIAERDTRLWAGFDFTFDHVGLTLEQIERFNVPSHPEKPDSYQWVGLGRDGETVIHEAMEKYLGKSWHAQLSTRDSEEAHAEAWLRSELVGLGGKWTGVGDL